MTELPPPTPSTPSTPSTPPSWQPPSGPPVTPDLTQPAPARSTARTALVAGLAVFAALIVVAAAILVPRVVDELTDKAKSPDPGGVETAVQGIQLYPGLSTEHRDDVDIDYPESPPVGGPHDSEWLQCGAYDEPVRNENVVHDLEHGSVWITYEPGLPTDDVAGLEELLPDNGILSPYPDLGSPVVVTVWGAQLYVDGADDPRLPDFIRDFGDGSTSPEPFASCEGGLTDPQGGAEGVDT
jgi:hypothetical protein